MTNTDLSKLDADIETFQSADHASRSAKPVAAHRIAPITRRAVVIRIRFFVGVGQGGDNQDSQDAAINAQANGLLYDLDCGCPLEPLT